MKSIKTHATFLFFYFLSSITYAQIKFEKGFYVDNDAHKVECFIKNVDWNDNPSEFIYKLTEDGAKQIGNVHNISEFGVGNYMKYVRANVKIDRSSNSLSELSNERNPRWSEEILFLKVLVEGTATLYIYESGTLNRFFYKVKGCAIEQLVYRDYLFENNVQTNEYYKQQLCNNLLCDKISVSTIKSYNFGKNMLVKHFKLYNSCFDTVPDILGKRPQRDLLCFKITPGINNSSLSLKNTLYQTLGADFQTKKSYRLGFDIELVLPFHKNKWALFTEPNYQYYKASSVNGWGYHMEVDVNTMELPIGLRYYTFLNRSTRFFIDCSLQLDYAFKSKVKIESMDDLNVRSRQNLAFGLGVNYKRLDAEIRYYTNKEMLDSYQYWSSSYRKFSLIFGYRLFKIRN